MAYGLRPGRAVAHQPPACPTACPTACPAACPAACPPDRLAGTAPQDSPGSFPEFALWLIDALREFIGSEGERFERLADVYNRGWPDGRRIVSVTAAQPCPETQRRALEARFDDDAPPLVFVDWEHLGATALLMLDPELRVAVGRRASPA